jgi:hypothetical protein
MHDTLIMHALDRLEKRSYEYPPFRYCQSQEKLRCLQAHCSHVLSNECEGAAEYGVLKAAKYFNHLRNMGCTTQDQ